jgi:hypothetical protein
MGIIRCLHYHPWSSIDEIAKRTRLIPEFVKKTIHADVAYEKKSEGKGANKVVLYRLKDRSDEIEE